ncbi:adenylyltransferase/cytidyltransferase family protein [candidate division WWE3 bacterium]|nr:adenylyltransferase/cytidyltransferase family protein [candidate division WWE3 bacterium]
MGDVFGAGSEPERRVCTSLDDVIAKVSALRTLGCRIVLTSGSWDLIHWGHGLYLERAHALGDALIVGVDSDERIKKRKGPHRPIVPEQERVTMLCFLRSVTLVYIKPAEEVRWGLIRAVKPDVLVVSRRTAYSEDELAELLQFCGAIEVIESQATTSTTARIRMMHVTLASQIKDLLAQLTQQIDQLVGGDG